MSNKVSVNQTSIQYLASFLMNQMTFSQRLKVYERVHQMRGFWDGRGDELADFPGPAALDALGETGYSIEAELDYKARVKAGRLANGAELDHGTISHAVNSHGALCGTKPGKRSVGWVAPYPDEDYPPITCQKCLANIDLLRGLQCQSKG